MANDTSGKKIKLTPRQKDIINKMRDGWILLIGQSDGTGRTYHQLSKGYENDYFSNTVFSVLHANGLIYQQQSPPFDWGLTRNGENIEL